VVARAQRAAHVAIDARCKQSAGERRADQEVVDGQKRRSTATGPHSVIEIECHKSLMAGLHTAKLVVERGPTDRAARHQKGLPFSAKDIEIQRTSCLWFATLSH
jgi:hypothetical protein